MGRVADVFEKPNFGLNCLELVLGAVSVGAVVSSYPILEIDNVFFYIYAFQIGCVIATILIIIGHILDLSMPRSLLLTISILGCLVWLTTGAFVSFAYLLSVIIWPFNLFFLSSIAAVNNAVIHLVDAVKLCRCNCCCNESDGQTFPAKHFSHAYIVSTDSSLEYARMSQA